MMHTNHLGFDGKSFSLKDSRGFYRNADFDTACATLLRGIRTRRGLLLLTSETGLGKTLLLHRCMAEAGDIRFILLGNPQLDFPDILNYLCANLGLSGDELDVERQSQRLRDALAVHAGRGQAVALLIDDAHHLRIDALQRLWKFVEESAVEADQRPQVVLAGLPEIEGKLRQPELRPLQKSLQIHCRLEQLSQMETGLFIAHQFEVAGHADDRLSPAVIERIAHYSQGVPRTIALLCDTILLLASLQAGELTPTMVDEAARSCFLSDSAPAPPVTPGSSDEFDLAGTALDFNFDFTLDEASAAEQTVALAPTRPAKTAPIQAGASQSAGMAANADSTPAPPPVQSPPTPAPAPPPAKPASAPALLPPLRAFLQLLDEIVAKQDRKNTRDREVLRGFRHRYQWLARNAPPAWLTHYEQRMARLAETQQPILVALSITPHAGPEPGGTLGILLINPSWWLYREIRMRLHSTDLEFVNGGRMLSLRLLDGRDAQPVYLDYRLTRAEPKPATLQMELDLLDHRGTWHAYRGPDEIRLAPPRRSETAWGVGQEVTLAPGREQFWLDTPESRTDTVTLVGATGDPSFTLPLELTVDDERTHRLRASVAATHQALGRGTALSRALLLAADPTQAPARIELVSRPFIILGRYNPSTGAGFGDFALGFIPEYTRISRLHAVICALGDQLALMPASDQDRTYTGQNGQRLTRGQWRLLEANDNLDICDLYHLKLTLAWDRHGEHDPTLDWDPQEPRDKFGHYLLDLVDVLHQRDQQTSNEDVRAILRNRYANLVSIQDRIAEINGVGNPGTLLHARFERDDEASRQVVHYYVPKWLSLGSSPQAGLPITAAGVAPLHAELLFREGMYWIQNLAGPGSIQVGCHGLATNEVLALETGDVLTIGAARFEFEAY
ncbi:MAG: AAA family ATPase [Candidatus Contendobacter sp.]|nr:AAA family ATPase [Candidatus Contendobacter sp.]MDS4058403.1 AAA family ATPase [Candidatus Contendobacter sp.]